MIVRWWVPKWGNKRVWNFAGQLWANDNGGYEIPYRQIVHQEIHLAQKKELLYVFYWLIYVGEWIYHLSKQIRYGAVARYSISFEREAFKKQYSKTYLNRRSPYAMWRKQRVNL